MKKTSRDVIILNLCNKKKHDHMMYAYLDMECLDRHNFLSFQLIFCFFARLLTSKIKIVKKPPGHITLLHMCAINQDHMMYGSWDMKFSRTFLSSWAFFYPFTPLTPWKWKYQKWKNSWRCHHFTQVYQKSWSSAILLQRYGTCRM